VSPVLSFTEISGVPRLTAGQPELAKKAAEKGKVVSRFYFLIVLFFHFLVVGSMR